MDVFISRLHPETVENELLECAKEFAATGGVKIVDMSCSKQIKIRSVLIFLCFGSS